jgi:RecA/RadA recombinase
MTTRKADSFVFISYTAKDEAWARWVAGVLEEVGLDTRIQVWDSQPGTNFVEWINTQLTGAQWTVALYSKAYFDSTWCTSEWTAALARGTLLPLRLEKVEPPATLRPITWTDLFGLDEDRAREQLLLALGLKVLPRVGPFPGKQDRKSEDKDEYFESGGMIPTGFTQVDAIIGGLSPGSLVVVSGDPGVGKSTFAIDIARHAAIKRGIGAVYYSLGSTRQEDLTKIISAEAKVTLSAIRTGRLADDEWSRVARHMEEIATAPLWIDDTGEGQSVDGIARSIKEMRLKGTNVGLAVVDYLQMLDGGIEQDVLALKRLSLSQQFPVILVSHLEDLSTAYFRQPSAGNLPTLIQQVADIIMLIYRPETVEAETHRVGEADIIVAKNRHGATGRATVVFQGKFCRFANMAPIDIQAPWLSPRN